LAPACAVLALAAVGARAQEPAGVIPGATAKTPVEIDAANLKWDDAQRMATYEGDVVVTQGEGTLHASRMRIYLNKDQAAQSGKGRAKGDAAKPAAAPAPEAGPLGATGSADIRRIEAEGPVTVVQKDQIGAGDSGEYDKAKDRIVLDGHVVLTQGKNVTAGARLVYAVSTRDVLIEGGRERVRSEFVQEQTPPAAAKPAQPKAAAPATGQPAANQDIGFPGAGQSSGPIQIEANRLQWFDKAQRAVYSGAVTAVQGESALRASRLTIFIERDPAAKAGKGKGKDAKAGAAPTDGGKGRIRRIEADGPVTITQKDQVATSSRATYDKPAHRVDLIGAVTLTQGDNVTTGQHLVYDLTTKQATMIGAGAQRAAAVFTPQKDGGPGGKAGASKSGGPAAAGKSGGPAAAGKSGGPAAAGKQAAEGQPKR
jgi:lipopolysaccharide export system protein LptA